MTTAQELAALREEVAALRQEVRQLRGLVMPPPAREISYRELVDNHPFTVRSRSLGPR